MRAYVPAGSQSGPHEYDKGFLTYWGRKPDYETAAQLGSYSRGATSSILGNYMARVSGRAPLTSTSGITLLPPRGKLFHGVPVTVGQALRQSDKGVSNKIDYAVRNWNPLNNFLLDNYSPAYTLDLSSSNNKSVSQMERMVVNVVLNQLKDRRTRPLIISQELSDSLQGCWAMMDVDTSGQVDKEDFLETIPGAKRQKQLTLNNITNYLDINNDRKIECYEEFLQCIIIRAMRRDTSRNPDFAQVVRENMPISEYFMAVLNTLQSFIQLEIDIINSIYTADEAVASRISAALLNPHYHNNKKPRNV